MQNGAVWYEDFKAWENRCRGWNLWDFAADLEPPFSAITADKCLPQSICDDARIGGGIKGLLSRNNVDISDRHKLPPVKNPVVKPKPFHRASRLAELQLKLPRELDVVSAVSEQHLLSLGNFKEPVAFEIFANSDSISIQLACSPDFSAYLKSQLKAIFPAVSITEREGFLASEFSAKQPIVLADFGLAKSFTLPLRLFRSFNPDPLAGLFSSFTILSTAEKAVFQILFQPVKGKWSNEILKILADTEQTKLLQDRGTNLSAALKTKLSSPLFAVTIRIMTQATSFERAWEIVRQIGGNLRSFNDPSSNELIALSNNGYPENDHRLSFLSRTSYRSGMLLNTSELASLVHLPSSSVRIEKLNRSDARSKALPAIALGHGLVLGKNIHDGQTRLATISKSQRTRHAHLIGSTGSGKTTLVLQCIRQDIEANEGGVCVIDPHGDLIDAVCEFIPENRIGDVVLFDPADSDYPIGFNIFQAHTDLEKTLISSDLVAAFKRMATSWGDVMDAVLANAVLAILESTRGGTLLDLKRFLVEKDFRTEFLQSVTEESVRYFWLNEFPLIGGKPQASILIRLDAFLRQKLIRNIVCQKTSKLNFREIMDNKKILLIKLSQGIIGLENSHFLGTLLVTKLHQIALSRQETTHRPFFAVYIDEFHNFVVPSIEGILSGIRKYNIALTLSHQEYRQLQTRSQEVAESVMSNCYTRICFRLGDSDAERFAKGFSSFDASALQNLGIGEAICRLEQNRFDFNLETFPIMPIDHAVARRRKSEVIARSRQVYATHIVASENESDGKIQITKVEDRPATTVPVFAEVNKGEAKETETNIPSTKAVEPKQNYGRAGQHHKELQAVIKRVAETYGFRVAVEQGIEGGTGRVDISLEKENLRIACEVSVTTTNYEITNILKCLADGYDHVIVVVSNQKKLPLINSKIKSNIPIEHQEKVKAFGLTSLLGFLRGFGSTTESTQTKPEKPDGQRLSFAEVCEFFDVTPSTLYRWVREGRVPFYRPGREYQFDRDELVLIGKHDLSGKRKASVKLSPLTIEKKAPKRKKEQDSRYRKLLKLD